jgi:NAD(P)H-hydrate epimerase
VLQPARALSRAENQEIDARAIALGMPSLLLMENAGLGLADVVLAELRARGLPAGSVVGIVCGSGNNGGDGLVLGRHLALRGYSPLYAYCGSRATADRTTDAGINLTLTERSSPRAISEVSTGAELSHLLASKKWAAASLLVDALFGTGLQGELSPEVAAFIAALDAAPQPIIAADLPSGLDCDTGRPLDSSAVVHAVRTSTNGARKLAFDVASAAEFTGEVTLSSLGCPPLAWSHVSDTDTDGGEEDEQPGTAPAAAAAAAVVVDARFESPGPLGMQFSQLVNTESGSLTILIKDILPKTPAHSYVESSGLAIGMRLAAVNGESLLPATTQWPAVLEILKTRPLELRFEAVGDADIVISATDPRSQS